MSSFRRYAALSAALGGIALACSDGYVAPRPPSYRPAYVIAPQYIVITKGDPPGPCVYRGIVKSEEEPEIAYPALQQQASALGATHVVLDGLRSGGVTWGYRVKTELFGRAFWCPPPPNYYGYAGAPTQPPPAPSPVTATSSPVTAASPSPPISASAAASAKPSQVPTMLCVPGCSKGYMCLGGSCTPACTPPCSQGQVCAPDRVCRAQ